MIENNDIHNKLIQLSKIFKKGFTIELKEGNFIQYSDINKPYIVAYKIILEIKDSIILTNHVNNSLNNCFIGGWIDNYSYIIELIKVFKHKKEAFKFAYKHKQKCIYDLKNMEVIEI